MASNNKGGTTVDRVWRIAEPIAEELGLYLWDIRFVKEGASWFLRIFIDSDNGITIDDCERMSKAIDKPLDDADPITQSYYLEVSSPGLGRELTRDEHFEILKGDEIRIKLIRPKDGMREFIGELLDYKDGIITIKQDDSTLTIAKTETAHIQLNDDKDIGGY